MPAGRDLDLRDMHYYSTGKPTSLEQSIESASGLCYITDSKKSSSLCFLVNA